MSKPQNRFNIDAPWDIVLLSTADWDNPFWTNKQHVAVELARRGHKVLYIDSLGLRRPTVSKQDLGRILRRLKKGLRPPEKVRERLWVWSPVVVPFQRYAVIRQLNKLMLGAGLLIWRKVLGLDAAMLWTYNPMTTRLLDVSGFESIVYHCVDEVKAQPGMPSPEDIDRAENELMAVADICFVTAEHLLETRRNVNPNTHYFSNVADYAHFSAAMDAGTRIPEDLAALPEPRVGFIGAISGYKIDFDILRSMAEAHPAWSIVLIGKVGEGDPWTDTGKLGDLSNLHFVGPRDYETLPAYLKGFDVAILPNMLNDYTRSMFPMKFYEYLAAGRPIVATKLQALRQHGDVAYLADGTADFIRGVELALEGKAAALEARLLAAKEQTYQTRTERMLAMIMNSKSAAPASD